MDGRRQSGVDRGSICGTEAALDCLISGLCNCKPGRRYFIDRKLAQCVWIDLHICIIGIVRDKPGQSRVHGRTSNNELFGRAQIGDSCIGEEDAKII